MPDLKYTDLPPRARGRKSFFVDFIPDLKKHSNKWAEVRRYDNPVSAASMASNLRQRFGPEGFEFASRMSGSFSVVFARFVGK